MNYSTAVMLFNENIRAISVTYEDNEDAARYTFKTLDDSIQVDDYVVIPTSTRHGATVVKVVEVDVEVDFDSSTRLKWIMGKFDKAPYIDVLNQEQRWIDAIKAADKREKREKIKSSITEMYKDGVPELETLKITQQ